MQSVGRSGCGARALLLQTGSASPWVVCVDSTRELTSQEFKTEFPVRDGKATISLATL